MKARPNLHIAIHGKGQPLVLLHGWGFDHTIWLHLAKVVPTTYQLYLVDLPGFGLSPIMSWDDFKRSLLKQLPEYFAIAGWSMGGLFATRFAIEKSRRVTHLINICSSPHFIKEKGWPGIEKTVFDGFLANLIKDPQQTVAKFVGLQLKNQPYYYQNYLIPNLTALKKGLQILATWDLREPLHFFNKPACFMFGRLDAITPRAVSPIMQKIYPNFDYFLFAKSAHMPFLSEQHEFLNILERILQ